MEKNLKDLRNWTKFGKTSVRAGFDFCFIFIFALGFPVGFVIPSSLKFLRKEILKKKNQFGSLVLFNEVIKHEF